MRRVVLIFALLIATSSFAQDTLSSTVQEQQMTTTMNQTEGKPVYFQLDTEEFKFVPNSLGYHIVKLENGSEIDYGTLVLTTDDGFYALTSNLDDHVSYGRFDDEGNFNAQRYDEESGSVLEEHFVRLAKRD